MGERRQQTLELGRFAALATVSAVVVGASLWILTSKGVTATGADAPRVPGAAAKPTVDPCAGVHHSAGASPYASAGPSSSDPACHVEQGGPTKEDFVDILDVRPNIRQPVFGPDASTGTFVSQCGRNENNHRNSDNLLTLPGVSNGAHHTHDYVGNISADGYSTDQSLAAAGTTCQLGDLSAYFWPVLRRLDAAGADADAPGGGQDGNVGEILRPELVRLEFRGNPKTQVVAMPRFLKMITGDATAGTNGPGKAKARWTCTGFTNRTTTKYPLCPEGSALQRVLVFPSCWDGKNTDSTNHRTHVVFPDNDGGCPQGTKTVPQLRITVAYAVPPAEKFALDSFPEQKHNPLTDHAVFVNVMPDSLMTTGVDCINNGQNC